MFGCGCVCVCVLKDGLLVGMVHIYFYYPAECILAVQKKKRKKKRPSLNAGRWGKIMMTIVVITIITKLKQLCVCVCVCISQWCNPRWCFGFGFGYVGKEKVEALRMLIPFP